MVSASSSFRSPSLRAEKSSMAQGRAEALRRRFLQISQDAVHPSNVDSRMPSCDRRGALPAALVVLEPDALLGRERVAFRHFEAD